MSVSSGSYSIRSAAFDQPYVGQYLDPEGSPFVRPVISLPPDSDSSLATWTIEDVGGDQYILKTEESAATVINELVYAIIWPVPIPEQWKLVQLPQYDNQYLILTINGTSGWVLPDGAPYTQVAAVPLTMTDIFPPLYPERERWIIESLD